jgi:hypothetical protein
LTPVTAAAEPRPRHGRARATGASKKAALGERHGAAACDDHMVEYPEIH